MARGGTKAFSRLPETRSDAWNSRSSRGNVFPPHCPPAVSGTVASIAEEGETFTSERFQREKERERAARDVERAASLLPRSRRGKRLPELSTIIQLEK